MLDQIISTYLTNSVIPRLNQAGVISRAQSDGEDPRKGQPTTIRVSTSNPQQALGGDSDQSSRFTLKQYQVDVIIHISELSGLKRNVLSGIIADFPDTVPAINDLIPNDIYSIRRILPLTAETPDLYASAGLVSTATLGFTFSTNGNPLQELPTPSM